MRSLFYYIFILSLMFFAGLSYAKNLKVIQENKGTVLLKGFLNMNLAQGGLSNLNPKGAAILAPSNLINTGVGINISAATFITNYIAIGAITGFNYYKVNKTTLQKIADNYITDTSASNSVSIAGSNASVEVNTGISSDSTYGALYHVPLGAIVQLHIAPFGAIRPYIGLGGSYNLLLTDSTLFTAKNKFGGLGQLGVDFIMENGTIYTLQLEKSIFKSSIEYNSTIGGASSDIDISPFTISIGVGYQF